MKVLLLTLFFSSKLFAADVNTDIKKMQLYLDKNNPEMAEEIYDGNDELAKSWMALERLGLSFERRNKYKEAIDVYRKLIVNFNQNAHKAIVANPKTPVPEDLYTTNKLPYYYYKLSFLNAQLFLAYNQYLPAHDRIRYKKNAEGYMGLMKKVNADENEIKFIQDLIDEKVKTEDLESYKANWYVFLDVISWQDRVYLKNMSTLQKTKLLSTAVGSSLGIGKKWSNVRYEFDVEGMYSFATATITSEDMSVNYQQSSVGVNSLIAGPGFYYKGFSDKVYVGVHIPFSYRKGDWTLPGGNYEFQNATQYGVGYFLQVKFFISNIGIQTRLGKIFPNPGSHWSIGGIYDF